jgi:cytochrome c556
MPTKARIVTLLVGVMVLGTATAQEDVIAERRALMRDISKQEHAANKIILGKFNPGNGIVALQKIQANMTSFVTLFPEGSETGGETHADPSIWANMADFIAIAHKTIADAKAAEGALASGQDAFAVTWQVVAENCGACHETYAPTLGTGF